MIARRLANVATSAALLTCLSSSAFAQSQRDVAARAAIHPAATTQVMQAWLARVPVTQKFPASLAQELGGQAGSFVIEMTTNAGCVPCGDAWAKLGQFRAHYRWPLGTLAAQDAMVRSGRLGLPWVGNPVIWVRPVNDPRRAIPVAIGTDAYPNLVRNIYLASKMLTGVRPDIGVRMMSKFTGIVGAAPSSSRRS